MTGLRQVGVFIREMVWLENSFSQRVGGQVGKGRSGYRAGYGG